MEPVIFQKFADLVFKASGIHLTEKKEALVSARIAKRMRTLGITQHAAYYDWVTKDKTNTEMRELINAISTNVTQFFREKRHFDFMAEEIRRKLDQGEKSLRIWCAACSTGEEPYTLSMVALDVLPPGFHFKVIASDISTKVLHIAKFGVYKSQDVRDLSMIQLKKYFKKGHGKAENLFRIKPGLRDKISFHQINLSTPPYPIEGGLDFIFCRNVMIYFNHDLRKTLVNNFQNLLKPGGHIFVGMSETLSGYHPNLKGVEPSVYQKVV